MTTMINNSTEAWIRDLKEMDHDDRMDVLMHLRNFKPEIYGSIKNYIREPLHAEA